MPMSMAPQTAGSGAVDAVRLVRMKSPATVLSKDPKVGLLGNGAKPCREPPPVTVSVNDDERLCEVEAA